MKRNKKLIKRLKAKSKKNFLSKKMSCDNVFCLKNTIVKIERNRAYLKMKGDGFYVKPENISVGIDMNGEHPTVEPNTGDHPFVDMKGNHPPADKK